MKKLLLLSVLSIILNSAVAQTPKVVIGELQGCHLKIGDAYSGGIVFYLVPGDDCHGLVCAPSDQAAHAAWKDAVTLCESLRLDGYSGWRLPSKYELNQMYTKLYKAGLGGFTTDALDFSYYWSSTENTNYAWYQDFYNGRQTNFDETFAFRVRAVRAF